MKKGKGYVIRKILAVVLCVAGVGSIGASLYIMQQVDEGTHKIKSAEKTLKKGDQLFSLNPATRELGKGLTGSAQKKIDEGKDLIEHYTDLAGKLKVGGIILFLVGVGLFFLPRKKSP